MRFCRSCRCCRFKSSRTICCTTFHRCPFRPTTLARNRLRKPRPWHIGEIAKFIVCIGPISSIFDYTTYAMMWFIFKCNQLNLVPPTELAARFPNTAVGAEQTYAAALFHTGWFVESLMTQTLIIHVIRTNLIPFIQSRASWQLTMTTIIIMAFAAYLPYLASRDLTRVCSATATLLAPSAFDVDLLCGAHASHQDLAHPQEPGFEKFATLSCRHAKRKDESASPHNVHGDAVVAERALSS